MFLTNVNQSESQNDFFTRAKTVSSNQRQSACVYISANLFTTGKVFGEEFFKLPAISSGLKSLLSWNWTSWTISNVYKDLQCYENHKICF